MCIERKRLFAHLAEGAEIVAARVVPNPHRYTLRWRDEAHTVEVAQAQGLVDEKLIAGKPTDALWDHIRFAVADVPRVRDVAFSYYPRGWGYCPSCGEFLEPAKNEKKPHAPVAARHGFTFALWEGKKTATPACAGSGKPLVAPTLPEAAANAAA